MKIERDKLVIKLKNAISNKVFLKTIIIGLKKVRHIFWINNDSIRRNQLDIYDYKKLKKKYYHIIEKRRVEENMQYKQSNRVWICWLQGIDNAPQLVKRCVYSIYKNLDERDITIITSENYYEYVNLPKYIINKWEHGIISNAHFSDLLRLELIINYGGIWMDSTVLCTDKKIPKYITNVPLFVYSNEYRGSDVIVASNWLISGNKNNNILVATRDLLYEYWKNEDVLINYFIFHLFFTMATEKYTEEWKLVHKFNNISPHILQHELFDKYSDERFEEIKSMSVFHKLNNKSVGPKYKSDTYYDYIINKGIEL
ncbi:capsular biosynthesis protein [Clostridium beijerinckii]|nr:capsular biosynthesis protein [Clostridium beijerinckii]